MPITITQNFGERIVKVSNVGQVVSYSCHYSYATLHVPSDRAMISGKYVHVKLWDGIRAWEVQLSLDDFVVDVVVDCADTAGLTDWNATNAWISELRIAKREAQSIAVGRSDELILAELEILPSLKFKDPTAKSLALKCVMNGKPMDWLILADYLEELGHAKGAHLRHVAGITEQYQVVDYATYEYAWVPLA